MLQVTMCEFGTIWPSTVRKFRVAGTKWLLERLMCSQPNFALHLRMTASTVRKQE